VSFTLKTESRAKNEMKNDLYGLNKTLADLNEKLRKSQEACSYKDAWIENMQSRVHESTNRIQEITDHYERQVSDKNKQITELRRCLDAIEKNMGNSLKQHSKVGIDLAAMLENEKRDWAIEREMLQSELYGTQQLIQEQASLMQAEIDQEQSKNSSLESELERLRAEIEDLRIANAELSAARAEFQSSMHHSRQSSYEKEINENKDEIMELRERMSKVNERIEENFQRTDAEMEALRRRLTETIEDRDRLVTELHEMKEKAYRNRVRGASHSSVLSLFFVAYVRMA